MKRIVFFALAISLGVVGCGGPGQVAEPVHIEGQVTLADGRPVKDVMLTLQPTHAGRMAGLKLGPDGSFRGEVVPGRYAYCVSEQEGKTPAERQRYGAAFKAIPEKYRSANMEHVVQISSGRVRIKLN